MKWIQHLRTINQHKWLVMKYCFRAGLYKQGLLHDMSKYSWTEFSVGVKYYQGYRSPNNAEREDRGFSSAWLHHKGRNKHHLEYWMDYSLNEDKPFHGTKMPVNYVVEMVCDRIAANKIYNRDEYKDENPLHYFEESQEQHLIHEDTKALLRELLTMLKEKGEKSTFQYIREVVLDSSYEY
ncbi:MAG: hypothetical protein K0R21_1225 [Anaerocolumna sp.]|nr:hypothetical protein [Anaerocolumna sp.]